MRILRTTELEAAARDIEEGGLVVVPTERWYMICCDASNQDACSRIYQAKRRPLDKSLLFVLPSKSDAVNFFQLDIEATRMIEALWPGDLALLLRWSDPATGLAYSSVGSEVALVGNPAGILGALARQASVLLAATSANISGDHDNGGVGPSITLEEVVSFAEVAGTEIAAVIDGGLCPLFTHMTIVDCSDHTRPAMIAREGAVHKRALAAVLGRQLETP